MTATRILRALDFGAMINISYTMRRDEREAVAHFLGKPGEEPGPLPQAYCKDRAVKIVDAPDATWMGWSPARDNSRFIPSKLAKLTADQVPRLKLKWAFGFDGDRSAFAQPTIIGDQIFLGSAGGRVQALRRDSGCMQWMFQAAGPVRSAIAVAKVGSQQVLLFGDLTGEFYALDAATGKLLWKKRPEEHESVRLTGAPVVYKDKVLIPVASWEETRAINEEYPCCTFRGSLTALRIRDGSEAWKTYTVDPPVSTGKTAVGTATFGPSGGGVWSAPALDLKRHLIYITTGNNYSLPNTPSSDSLMALDLETGRILWSKQAMQGDVYNSACGLAVKGPTCPEGNGPDYDFGTPPMLVKTAQGRELVLAGQKAGLVYAFDPLNKGEIVWQTRVGQGGINGGVLWGMASDGERVYVTTSDAVIKRTVVTRSFDPNAGGGLNALRVADGSKDWYVAPSPCGSRPDCSPAQSAAVTEIPGVVFTGSMDGHLRAYTTQDGKPLWEFDTVRDYQTVNGVKAKGGAVDGPGATIVNGMLFLNSGYARQGGIAGNVFLAFAPE